MKLGVFAVCFAVCGVAHGSAGSATLSSAQGSVMLNQGKQFVPIRPGQILNAGDRLMVMQGGSAQLRFADGCDVTVEGGSLLAVPTLSTCAGGSLNTTRLANEAPPWVNPEAPSAYGTGTWMLVGAGALVVAGLLTGSSDNDRSISP